MDCLISTPVIHIYNLTIQILDWLKIETEHNNAKWGVNMDYWQFLLKNQNFVGFIRFGNSNKIKDINCN